jgi:hypothetical protein
MSSRCVAMSTSVNLLCYLMGDKGLHGNRISFWIYSFNRKFL